MDEEQNDLWLEEESEELSEEVSWEESILDFADWQQDEDTSAYDEGLEEALAEERIAALESELEQDEHPLEAEDNIAEMLLLFLSIYFKCIKLSTRTQTAYFGNMQID